MNPSSSIKKNNILWKDALRQEFASNYMRLHLNPTIIAKYIDAFPKGYAEIFSVVEALADICVMENTTTSAPLNIDFSQIKQTKKTGKGKDSELLFKLYHLETITLSKIVPIFEHLGFKVISENTYLVTPKHGVKLIYISEFRLLPIYANTLPLAHIKEKLFTIFAKVWKEEIGSDHLNALTLLQALNWREISVLRAYKRYLQQVRFPFSQDYISSSLTKNSHLAMLLLQLFITRFNPSLAPKVVARECDKIRQNIIQELTQVASADEDQIIKQMMALIDATMRTNYFQNKDYISFKIKSSLVPNLPLPVPWYEIFVYSAKFEAIHLRMAAVARGGIRWSDRQEDFRTEVLGLMKAQQVKNTVIVPQGAKGGFVLKNATADGVACYQDFIRGMLDITDNIHNNELVPPKQTVCHDAPDPYLVVAADKGTAGFSDIANQISAEYNFWLGDAFASGGRTGYSHKAIGITAKGAFESVNYLLRVAGIDIHKQDFTVVGVGDMSGDVFGNGMLLSRHIKLIGAFDRTHIFLDPNPQVERSYAERLRMFKLPHSSWADYDSKLISPGGGVFARSSKVIKISKNVQNLLGLPKNSCGPNEIITALLKAQVDLLWLGGIGTYVKANAENDLEVNDRDNDRIRIDADQLKCKVIGEGANLGLTQKARVQFSLHGGFVYTDFIDNSGGVNCSDHEVNLKILLNDQVAKGKLRMGERNKLLRKMTAEVESIVLRNNYQQVRAIDLITASSPNEIDRFIEIINRWEKKGLINRQLEGVPDNRALLERKRLGQGLTRPEVSILFSYAKLFLKKKILSYLLPDKLNFRKYLIQSFPSAISKLFGSSLLEHRLAGEIIATELSNSFITNLGITFIKEVQEETGVSIKELVYAYVITEELLDVDNLVATIAKLENKIDIHHQKQVMLFIRSCLMQTIRWLLINVKLPKDINLVQKSFAEQLQFIFKNLTKVTHCKENNRQLLYSVIDANLPEQFLRKLEYAAFAASGLNIIMATQNSSKLLFAANLYFAVTDKLDINWLNTQIDISSVNSHWTQVAKASLRSDLVRLQQILTHTILLPDVAIKTTEPGKLLSRWMSSNTYFCKRWAVILDELKSVQIHDMAMLFVAIRQLNILAQSLTLDFAPNAY